MGGRGSGRKPNTKVPDIGVTNDNQFILPNYSGDHGAGHVNTPTEDTDLANKKYVDDNILGGSGDDLGDHVATQTISGSDIVMSGEISGSTYYGDGSNLTGIAATGGSNWLSGATYISPLLGTQIISGAGLVTTGTISGADYSGVRLDAIEDPTDDNTISLGTHQLIWRFNNPSANPMEIEATGGYTGALLHLHQNGGNPGSTYLLELESDDDDVEHIKCTTPSDDNDILCTYVAGDGTERYQLLTSGLMRWGDGTAARDVGLKRVSAGLMELSGALTVSGAIIADSYNGEDISGISGATVTNTANIDTVSGALVALDGEVDTISGSLINLSGAHYTLDDDVDTLSGAYYTHAGDSTDPHGVTLTQAGIISSGAISGAAITLTQDRTGALSGAAYVVNTIFGTGATAPTASGYPIGTIYLQYTP